ncbi:DUF1329 domain-containing protein [Sinimarinibacterium sp. CAU 1509]|uniref:DUF1329 domain-containing protein n=1 Tax=Sinimarinibacterium sp. CAU 1509 TaxID=2562283 RepID=UPI0010AB529A|nr:DUF1329 domain-containing protein [Sinimarinibacterium sp. CAU 1509]TJY63255.1 DUF1329 domain-containing protein [Sinimarinibacterium sp. CAU 1509]
MHIRKYDFNYSRRMFMEKTLKGIASAGVLAPMWPLIANGADISKAYPDELLSIEMYTKGKIKPGDFITAANVDVVKDLLDPISYMQVKEMGRRIEIVESVKDASVLFPNAFLEATLKNQGKAEIGADGNIYAPGKKAWIGGLPFPDPKTGEEVIANITLSWGRHDYCQYAIRQWDIAPDGSEAYQYDFVWAELQATGRLDGTVFQNKADMLRFQSVWFTAPNDIGGTAFLSSWHYDQNKFPDLYGYLPAFKRVRQFPTNQRFEPLVPGVTWFLSDAWAAGDPMLTWGNYKIVGRQPMLGAVAGNFSGSKKNWEAGTHGGPKGKTFWDSKMQLVPECIVLEAEPTGYPRSPVGKKRIWIDTRNQLFVAYNTFDRRGDVWKSFEAGWSRYEDGGTVIKDANGNPDWSWTYLHSHDVQSNRMSRIMHTESCSGGYKSELSAGSDDVYNKFMTTTAIQRLGT